MPVVKRCLVCKKEFKTKPFFVQNGRGKYCSRKCSSQGLRCGKWVTCSVCGTKVYKQKRALQNSKSGKLFCSKSCQTTWRNTYFSGEKHANWIHGLSTYRRLLTQTDRLQKCVRCGIDDVRVLAVHHIDRNRKNNKLSNLLWLCHNCHHLIHRDKVEEQKFMATMV